jgi:iron complex transport system substrate-binding protein
MCKCARKTFYHPNGHSPARWLCRTTKIIYAQQSSWNIGTQARLSYELIFSLAPEVVFAYGVRGEFSVIEKKLNELGLKVVYFGEYMEDTPLGKAEWIVAMSAFFAGQQRAEDIFEQIERFNLGT